MSEFNIYEWNKKRHLIESRLNESVASQAAEAINQAIAGIDDSMSYTDFAKAVATILKDEYGTHNFNPFMEVLHAELGMEESLNETEEMATYKVTVTLAEPGEGGPDYDEDVEVKVDASLSGDELRSAVRDAIGKEGYNRKNIYKFKYEKA
jgi:hypothetical protein